MTSHIHEEFENPDNSNNSNRDNESIWTENVGMRDEYFESSDEFPITLYDISHHIWMDDTGELRYTDQYFEDFLGTPDQWELLLDLARTNVFYQYGEIAEIDYEKTVLDFYAQYED